MTIILITLAFAQLAGACAIGFRPVSSRVFALVCIASGADAVAVALAVHRLYSAGVGGECVALVALVAAWGAERRGRAVRRLHAVSCPECTTLEDEVSGV